MDQLCQREMVELQMPSHRVLPRISSAMSLQAGEGKTPLSRRYTSTSAGTPLDQRNFFSPPKSAAVFFWDVSQKKPNWKFWKSFQLQGDFWESHLAN